MPPRHRDGYRRGGFYRIDDRTGFQVRATDTRKEWDGTIVASEDFETRQPQDLVRARRDRMAVPDARPEPPSTVDGPFILINAGENGNEILIEDGMIRIYRMRAPFSASEL